MARASVIVPAHNAAADIGPCLEAILGGGARDFEVIVIDDRSSDTTAELARQAGVRVVANPGPEYGPSAARNLGASLASGSILVFVDADVVVHPGTIERAIAQLEAEPELGAVCGAYDDRPHASGDIAQWRNLLHCYTHRIARRETNTFWTGFGAIRRRLYLDAGGLNTHYQSIEDMELGARLHSQGVPLRMDATLEVKHRKKWTLASMLRTDLFGRAIPYARLMLREGMANDLNVRVSQRASVALTGLAIVLLLMAPLAAAACIAIVAALNLPFYRFLARTRGAWFALRTFPLHLIYFIVGGTGFAIVQLRYGLGGPLAVFFALALLIQGSQGAFFADAYESDEPAHIVTGLMLREYVTRGWTTPPMEFAEDFYRHYPKVALGHWPPMFYLLQSAWTLALPDTRGFLLLLMALLAALLATGVWKLVREEYGPLAAWCAAVALVSCPGMATYSARVMTEVPLALLMFAAMLAYARYLDSGRTSAAVAFGVLSLLGLLTKGTALALVALPPLGIVLTGKWRLLRTAGFWLPAAIAAPAALWYLFAPGALHQRSAAYGAPGFARRRLQWPPEIWSEQFGWIVASMVLLGVIWMGIEWLRGRRLDGLRASALAMVAAGSVFPLLFRAWERRHQTEEAGAFLLVAALGLGSFLKVLPGGPRWKGALIVLLAAMSFRQSVAFLPPQPSPGLGAVAQRLISVRARAILICCGGEAEGALISAVALREPSPQRYLLRGTQLLVNSDWLGFSVESKVTTRAEMDRLLKESPIDAVVLDQRTNVGPGLRELLEQSLREHPELWRMQGRPPLVWFTRIEPLPIDEAERKRRLQALLPDPSP